MTLWGILLICVLMIVSQGKVGHEGVYLVLSYRFLAVHVC